MEFQKSKIIKFLGVVQLITFLATHLFANDDPQGMTLSKALETALKGNPTLMLAKAQRDASEAKIAIAKSDLFPSVTLSSGYTRYKEPNIIVPIHETGVFPPLDKNYFETITQLGVPLFDGGRTAESIRAARATAKESAEQEKLTEQRLVQNIAQIYIQSQELQDKKNLLVSSLQVLRQRYRELSLLLMEGRVSKSDLALVASSMESYRSDSLGIESGFYHLAVRLGQLLGVNTPIWPLVPSEHDLLGEVILPDSMAAVSQIAGPEVRKGQAQLERSQALKAQASKSYWPEINGFSSYFLRSGGDLDMIGEWAAGIRIVLPIFEGGRRQANLRVAEASVNAAQQSLQSVLQAQNATLEIALEQWNTYRVRQQQLSQAVDSKLQSVIAQRQLYEAGRLSLSELLTQETELLQLQMKEREMSYGERMAILEYHTTAGTLTSKIAETIVTSLP